MGGKLIASALKLLLRTQAQELSNASGWMNKLGKNLEEYREALETEEYRSLKGTLERVKKENCLIGDESSCSVHFRFVCEGLGLLMCLKLGLSCAEVSVGGNGQSAKLHHEHTAPHNLLSVPEQTEVCKLVQLVAAVGIYPYLLPGVGLPLSLRMSNPVAVDKVMSPFNGWYLYRSVWVLVTCIENNVLGPLIISNILPDLLSSLVQICYAHDKLDLPVGAATGSTLIQSPSDIGLAQTPLHPEGDTGSSKPRTLDSTEKEWCMAALKKILNQIQQSVVVKELLILQGMPRPQQMTGKKGESVSGVREVSVKLASPAWLRRACGQLLSERLMCKNGLQSVLRGIFEATSRKSSAPTKFVNVFRHNAWTRLCLS